MRARRALTPTAVFLMGSLVLHGVAGGAAAWLAHHARVSQRTAQPDPRPVFSGDSFDITAAEDPRAVAAPDLDETSAAETAKSVVRPSMQAARAGAATGANAIAAAETPPTYGATGDRSAVGVLVAISRGFPQAASTDPDWARVPLGSAGQGTMEIELDADGNLVRWGLDAGASPALRQGMVRTMALIGGRSFVARGAVTRLVVSARVSTDAVRDGTDSVYALHSEHDGADASAYFSLSIGRRIDLVLHELR